jgi:hypothetical protein
MPEPVLIALGLTLFAVLWFAAGAAYSNRRRRTPDDAKLTPAQAMANARTDVPDETRRLERGDATVEIHGGFATLPLPEEHPELPWLTEPETVTGDLGATTPPARVTVAEMAGAFEGGPDSVEWLREQRDRPTLAIGAPEPPPNPEPSVVLTISHLPPKEDGTTVHGRRFDNITPGAKLPQEVFDTWATVLGLRDRHGGTVLVAVKHPDGPLKHFEPSKEHPNEWPRGASQALKQAHEPTPVPVAAMTRSEAWAGRW